MEDLFDTVYPFPGLGRCKDGSRIYFLSLTFS